MITYSRILRDQNYMLKKMYTYAVTLMDGVLTLKIKYIRTVQ